MTIRQQTACDLRGLPSHVLWSGLEKLVVLCVHIALLTVSPLAGAALELPAEWPLGVDSHLAFELDGADLYLTTQTSELPIIRAGVVTEGESARLEFNSSGGRLTVHRPGDGEGEAPRPRLRIDVALGPGATVRVAGADLSVRAEDSLADNTGRSAIRLALERSTVKLKGVRINRLEAVDSSVAFSDTEGELVLTLTGGKAQVQNHQGRLELVATKAAVAVVDHHGQIVPDLKGGSLEIGGGKGTFEGIAADAYLAFDDWRGPVEVRANNSVVDALGGEHR